jgi:GNAT superfamily N-acetyltransferase
MEPEFKLAALSDIDTLIELMRELYLYDHLSFNEEVARAALPLILSNPLFGQVHLICLGEDVIGYLVLTFGFSLEYGGRDAFIDEFYLREKWRGRGIGKIGLQFAAEVCRGQGVQALHLEVERANVKAQAVYRRAGFVDHDRYLMTKYL